MEILLNKIKKYIPTKLFKAMQPAYHFLLSFCASALCGWPSSKIIVIGVTGTTGKTTAVYLIAKMFASAGYKAGFTSTAIFNDGKKEWLNNKKMTMPGRFFTQRMLKKMVKNKCQYAIIETTSQGIEQFRHKFINYDILVFTGLYPEHIEAHGSFENYKRAKSKLFAHLKQCKTKYSNDKKFVVKAENGFKKISANRVKKTIIANGDDKYADYFMDFWAEEKLFYSKEKRAGAVEYGDIKSEKSGVSFKIGGDEVKLNLLGEYNAANAMSAVCAGLSQGVGLEKIKSGLEKISGVPGRMEVIKNADSDFIAIVDYAYEPEALRNAYDAVLKLEHNKIIHVLGSAGGGRDAARRPKLGEVAGQNADFAIITNEDPYDEDPAIIIDQVADGAIVAGKIENENLFKIQDRREAIKKALSLAGIGDIVLITGKGCEQAICAANGVKIPWDDRKEVENELKNLSNNKK
ncbi:MAG: UDP-N-acetylmuramyl-tripeptide synthetase [bacterium]